MKIHLGINDCFAVKRWPRPVDWARLVREELGLDLVELSFDLLEDIETPAGRRAVVADTRAALAEFGLRTETTFTGLAAYATNLLMHPDARHRAAARRWYRRMIDLTAALGARGTGGHVATMSVADHADPARRDARWTGLAADLRELAAYARRVGLDFILVENLVSQREPATMDRLAQLLTPGDAAHVPLSLCLDLSHQCVPGTTGVDRDPYAWLARFGGRLEELQVSQNDGSADIHWPFTPTHNRAGRIAAPRVLDALEAAGAAEVRLVLEIFPGWEQPDDEVLRDLRLSVDYWRDALAARGLSA